MLYTLHTAQVNLSWSPDIFGGGRAKVRSARAAATAQAARRDLARSTIVANLVQSAIQYAALGEEIEATRDAVTAYRDVLALIKVRQKLGAVGASDVAAQETALAAIEGQLPGLERARKAQEAQIAVLIGVAPGTPCPPAAHG
jgi:outer membrane protein TolC